MKYSITLCNTLLKENKNKCQDLNSYFPDIFLTLNFKTFRQGIKIFVKIIV